MKAKENIGRVSPMSPFIPKTFGEWISQKLRQKENKCRHASLQIRTKQKTTSINVKPLLEGKILNDHMGTVLCRETIWVPIERYQSDRPVAPWPTADEFKHEGDDRSKSGFARFPPLPRDPGNATVNWKQRRPLNQSSFDEIGRPKVIMDKEGASPEKEMIELIGRQLLEEFER